MSTKRKAKTEAESELPGITSITVEGYKSIAEPCTIEVRPLTILAGANSSGKSSIMQPLLLLKQTLEATYDPGPLKIDGPNVCFSQVREMLPKAPGPRGPNQMRLTVGLASSGPLTNTYRYEEHGRTLELAETEYPDHDQPFCLQTGLVHGAIVQRIPAWIERERLNMQEAAKSPLEWRVVPVRGFLSLGLAPVDNTKPSPFPFLVLALPEPVSTCANELMHLPGLRGNPERTYRKTGTGPVFPGLFVQYPASLINEWRRRRDPRLADLAGDLARLGLTWKVWAGPVTDTELEIRVGRLLRSAQGGSRDLVNIADVGFGVSQVLPVLVALRAADRGRLVYIEQPEIHLHPKAQVALAAALADAANRGVRVVAETHSALLLLSVETLVAEGRLASRKVKLHWFSRRADGVTEVTPGDLDEAGAFKGWPQDFGPAELEAMACYHDAAAKARRRAG